MKRIIALVITFVLSIGTACYAQGKISRQTKQDKQSNTSSTVSRKSKASTQPKVSDPDGFINGNGYVDLGLSVKWAVCNIGATTMCDYGDLYQWGVAYPGDKYSYNNHPLKDVDQDYSLPSNYDTATKLWGSPWRMPTIYEFEELINKCEWKWTNINGYNGYVITGPNKSKIFLPAAGSTAADYYQKGVYGMYWSSSMRKDEGLNVYQNKRLYFKKGRKDISYGHGPHVAMSIRPVIK